MTDFRRAVAALISNRRPSRPLLFLAIPALACSLGVVHAAGVGPHLDTRLMLTAHQWAMDQRSSTMDAMFPPNGFAMRHPVLVWWLTLELLGLLAFPFTFLFLSRFPDRGFVVAKTMGLLLVGYIVWLAASVGVATFDISFIWLVVLALFVIAAALTLWLRTEIAAFVLLEWRRVLSAEAVFLAGFALFILLRMWYPDLGHQYSPVSLNNPGDGRMGEKQMELAFLNAIVRSRVFPPFDPFFAHGYINYYYYGFVLVGTLCKLTEIAPATGFNLAIATFFAMLVGNVFSVVQALTRRVVPGVIAALFVGVIGNLNGAWQLLRGLMGVATVHSDLPLVGGVVDVISGLQQVIFAHQPLPAFDFWEPTRIVPPAGSAISEFPYFTYLFADLHPHLMAFPMTVAALAFGTNLMLGASTRRLELGLSALLGGILLGALLATNPWDFPTYLGVVALGALVGAFALRRRIEWSLLLRPALWLIALGVLSFILYLPFERGYHTVFTTGLGLVRNIDPIPLQGLCQNNPTPCNQVVHETLVTPLRIYLEHFGLFLFLILSYLVVLLAGQAGGMARWRRWALRLQFVLYYREHLGRLRRVARVARKMRRPEQPIVDGSLVLGLAVLFVGLLLFRYYLLAILVALVGLTILLLARLGRQLPEQQLFLLALLAVPIALSIGTQLFYVKDFLDGSSAFRMNTIFKFYNQAWVLYAICAALALYYLVVRGTETAHTARVQSTPAPVAERDVVLAAVGGLDSVGPPLSVTPAEEAKPLAAEEPPVPLRGWRRVSWFMDHHAAWTVTLLLLIAASLVYSYAGTVARETYRQSWLPENSVPFTLDGMAFMKVAYPDDYAGISWLNAHVSGAPVIAEADDAGYNWRSRVAMFTGLPDIINGIHEGGEQRYSDEIDPTSLCGTSPHPTACLGTTHSRSDDLKTLYDSTDQSAARRVIRTYHIRYIYVGFSERQEYSAAGIAKFRGMVGHGLSIAYHHGTTTIYRVRRA